MIKLGSHVSFKAPDYLAGSAREAISYGANTMMIYLGPPQNTKRIDVTKYQYQQYEKNYKHLIKNEDILVHAPYIVNPANPEKADFAQQFLVREIERMNYIGAKYLVLHPGSQTKFDRKIAIKTLINTLKKILDATNDVTILLETMAGKGGEIGINFDELSSILNQIKSERIGICLDTCHVWESGFNLKNLPLLIDQLKATNLLSKIKAIHLNDSKNDLGMKKDRHENIGKGKIGLNALKNIVHAPEFANVMIILETPWIDNKPPYKTEIALLK